SCIRNWRRPLTADLGIGREAQAKVRVRIIGAVRTVVGDGGQNLTRAQGERGVEMLHLLQAPVQFISILSQPREDKIDILAALKFKFFIGLQIEPAYD